jgi:hypothetical protein
LSNSNNPNVQTASNFGDFKSQFATKKSNILNSNNTLNRVNPTATSLTESSKGTSKPFTKGFVRLGYTEKPDGTMVLQEFNTVGLYF